MERTSWLEQELRATEKELETTLKELARVKGQWFRWFGYSLAVAKLEYEAAKLQARAASYLEWLKELYGE